MLKSFFLWLLVVVPALAKRKLTATSLVTCMANSQITPSHFNVTFDPETKALNYALDLTTEISGNVTVHAELYAYGFLFLNRNIDLCSLGWKQFCPIFPGPLQIESVQYIPEKDAKQIIGIAYDVPDIDAVVKVKVYDKSTGELLSCLQSSFSNGKTVAQTGVKWATACIAGLGLLIAAVLSTFGNSNAASHIATNAVTLFLYFQSVVVVSMQSVNRVPPIASAWSENLAWSMGLIRVTFMQKIFRWYVQSTGGTPTLLFTGTTKQILVQRAKRFLSTLHAVTFKKRFGGELAKRAVEFNLESNSNLEVLRGIERIGYNSHIEPTSIVITGFTFFVFVGFILAVILVAIKSATELLVRFGKMKPTRLSHFRKSFPVILKGALLRYVFIGFPQLIILSLWEFTKRDSPAVIVLACLTLLLALGIVSYAFWNTWRFGTKSSREFQNPAALLYGNTAVLHKYGFFYTMFRAEKYWFGIVLVAYALFKGIFVGLCQGSGKVSSIVIFLIDLAYSIFLFIQHPYMNRSTNILNYCITVVVTINSFLFVFFSDLFGQPAKVGSIMGWVFFVINAAFSLVLLAMIIVLICIAIFTKNPDARFAPAKDDRTSFQRKSSVKHKNSEKELSDEARIRNELIALGAAAKHHQANWEDEMYRLSGVSNKSNTSEKHLSVSTGNNSHAKSTDKEVYESGSILLDEKKSAGDQMNFSKFIPGMTAFPTDDHTNSPYSNPTTPNSASVIPGSPSTQPLTHQRHDSVQSGSVSSNYSDPDPTHAKGFV